MDNTDVTQNSNFLQDVANAGVDNMSKLFTFMTAMLVSSASAGLLGKIVSGLTGDLGSVKNVLDNTLIAAVTTACGPATFFHNAAVRGEPDLSGLTLHYITKDVNFEFQLTSAATYLPQNQFFNRSWPLVIYLHGFTDNPEKEGYSNIGQAFLSHGNYNVVALDASSLIKFLYLRSSIMVEFIGQELGKMMKAAYDDGMNPENIHLIGHSLGSHIAGFAGKTFTELTGKRIGRISGLDPAGPCFTDKDDERRLSKDDADFVFVMHTDMGVYGLSEQIGHVDFYPNGGYGQPNCVLQTCSHSRAWQLFAESVTNLTAFYGVSCDDYDSFRKGDCDFGNINIMGLLTSPCAEGKYFLATNKAFPYGLGKEGLVYGDDRGLVTRILNKIHILSK